MQDRKKLPNPDLDAEQHLRVLRAAGAAMNYDAGVSIKVGDVFRQAIFREGTRIKPNQVSNVFDFFVDLSLVEYDDADNTYALIERMVDWARAEQTGGEDAAAIMQSALSESWLGKAVSQTNPSDPAALRKSILVEAGLDETNDDPTTLKQVQILVELAGTFELAEVVETYYAETVTGDSVPEPPPVVEEAPPPQTALEPTLPEPQATPPQAQYTPVMPAPGGTTVTVSVDDNTLNVQIHVDLQLPRQGAERRLDLLLKALQNQILAQLPDESS